MKRLSIIFAVMLVLLAGCIQTAPPADTPAAISPVPTASVPAAPPPVGTETPEPAGSAAPAKTPDAQEPPAQPAVSARTESRSNERIDVDISCPGISGMLDVALQQEVNESAYNYINNKAAGIEREAAEDGSPMPYFISSRFSVRRNDGLFLSISEEIQFYNGGVNTGTILKFINLKNTAPGRRLALGDLFLPGVDCTAEINGRISDMIADNPEKADFDFQTISDDQEFYLTGSNLVIAFQTCEIAPAVFGPPEFYIPLADLRDILIPELN